MSSTTEQFIAELQARQAIHDVLIRYCRGADRCDAAMIKSCFHEDGWDNHGFFNGPASEFADLAVISLGERFLSTKHFMTNESVEIVGTEARSETYILAILRKLEEGVMFDVTVSARYLDRFECRGGQWKIVNRLLVSDGTRVDKVERQDPHMDQGKIGARGAQDPSHAFFGLESTGP
jgi:hypothetical protein